MRPFSRRSESASRGRGSAKAAAEPGGFERPDRPLRPPMSRPRDRRCPSQSGWGQALGARKRSKRSWGSPGESRSIIFQPLTRDTSASSLRKEPTNRLPYRAPRESKGCWSGSGFLRFAGRACGSFRLQKSMSGAWRRALASEELAKAARSSPSSLESEGRKSVGSRPRVAKPGVRWRVRVRGGRASDRQAGNSSTEGASGRGSHPF